MISTALNPVSFTWYSSPASTELEILVTEWAAKAYQLPKEFLVAEGGGGCIYNTAGEAMMLAVHAAKWKKRAQLSIASTDNRMLKFVGYYSELCHISSKKALYLKDVAYIK